jgi:hypothetical protein
MAKSTKKPAIVVDHAARARILATTHEFCDNYNAHPEHPVEMRLQKWVGGGTHIMTCPGTKRTAPRW